MAEGKENRPVKMLVLGGCRSGKSRYAERWIADNFARKTFIATLEAMGDAEMDRRIDLHCASRGDDWHTVEEPVDVARALVENKGRSDILLLDCLTMWITNMMMRELGDKEIEQKVRELAETVRVLPDSVVLVANEVGLGIVPESAMARRFRDLAGWTNQQLAEACDTVVFVAAGLPMRLKG